MNLSTLQKNRLIYLLGPRFKKNCNQFKIVYRHLDTLEKNLIKAFDILKMLYIECKRAPIFHPVKTSPKTRKIYFRKYLGKNKEERENNLRIIKEKNKKELEEFEILWENRKENFTLEKIEQRVMRKIQMNKDSKEEFENKSKNLSNVGKLEDLPITKSELENKIIENKKLTPAAFRLFFTGNQSD